MSEGLAPWLAAQQATLLAQRGHAWLLQGPSGLGQYDLALALATAWLCETPVGGEGGAACGNCASCHLVSAQTHPDLALLLPETDMIARGWALDEKAQKEIDDKKRKPSQQIRVEAMQHVVQFAQRTAARGRGKAVLVYPAERMNAVTANALLKTLEEPPGDLRFVLASEAAHQLLPTIRSRCLGHTMAWPDAPSAEAWLVEQGLEAAAARGWLRAAGGRPQAALAMSASGLALSAWHALPRAVAAGDASKLSDWSPPRLVDALQKLCHDLLAARQGAEPRFFEPADLPAPPPMGALARWSKALTATARTVDHPFNPGLMLEALVSEARQVLHSRA